MPDSLFVFLQKIKFYYNSNFIHPSEAIALTILAHVVFNEPKKWKQGVRNSRDLNIPINQLQNFSLEDLWNEFQEHFNLNKFQPEKDKISFWDFFISYRIKNISERVFTTLYSWRFLDWNLILYERVLTPTEVLILQANGQRCVSVFWNAEQYNSHILKDKNSFEFTIHDLEHAERFFYNNEIKEGQIIFYKKLLNEVNSGIWNIPLTELKFKEDFEYLLSDMNTHPEHQKQYLAAILFNYQKRNRNCNL